MTTTVIAIHSDLIERWQRFTAVLEPGLIALVGTEDVVAALIDRSLLQEEVDRGELLAADDLVRLDRADRAYKLAAPLLLDTTDIALFKDDEPATHWWWHIEELVLGQASNLLLNVPQAAESKGVHPHTIRAAINQGSLPARRLARGFLVQRRDLERWQPRRAGRPKGGHGAVGDALLESFNDANTRGDFERASAIARAIEHDPGTTRRRLALALDAYNHGDAVQALKWTEQALVGELPDRSRQTALLVKGRALLMLGRAGAAKRVLDSAVGAGHIDALVSAALADAHLALGHRLKSVEWARRAVAQAPDVVELTYLLARMEWHDDQLWKSLEHVLEFRAARPDDQDGRLLHVAALGLVGDRMGDPSCYLRVIEILGEAPNTSLDGRRAYGVAAARLGRRRPALAALRRLTSEHRDEEGHVLAAAHVADAILASLGPDDPDYLRTIEAIEGMVGPSEATSQAKALRYATAGDVAKTCDALGVELEAAGELSPEAQQVVAMALLNADRGSEAVPLLHSVAVNAEDPEVIHMAVKGALLTEDLATAQGGLQRLSATDSLAGRVAQTALQFLDVGERTGRAQALLAILSKSMSSGDYVPQSGISDVMRHAPDGPWEGLHPVASPMIDNLMRAALN